jgi:ATP-binding cassette subfamily B protein
MQETVQGIRIVKAFTLEDVMRARLDNNVAELEHESNKWARVAYRASPLMEALGGFAVAGALIYGGFRVIETGATPGQFFSFLAAFMLAYEPAKRLARLNIDLNTGLVGVRILFEIVDTPPTEPSDDDKPALKVTEARVEFDDVRFGYRADEPVIRGMTFGAEPGRMTALVGPSGGGKSTVFNLMLRFYEADAGSIRIDGQDIAGVSRRSLRRQVAYVGQDVFLFHGSVARTSPSASRARARRRSSPPPRPPTPTSSSAGSRTATTRRWASAARSFPAASASGSRSRGRWSRTRRSSCWTRRPRRSIPSPSGWCRTR